MTGPAKAADPNARPITSLDEAIIAMLSGDGKGGLAIRERPGLDVLPIEASFKVSKKPEDRAIGGLSMGGGQTVNVAFNKPDMFRYVVIMSPAVNAKADQIYATFLGNAAEVNKHFKLFWVGVGKDDTLTGPGDKDFDQVLQAGHHAHVQADRRAPRMDRLASPLERGGATVPVGLFVYRPSLPLFGRHSRLPRPTLSTDFR